MSLKEDIEKVENKMKKIEEESFAMELLKDQRKQNKRLFIIILVILSMWFVSIGLFIYYINTTGYEEDYREQTINDLENTNDLDIINGDNYGDSKASKKN